MIQPQFKSRELRVKSKNALVISSEINQLRRAGGGARRRKWGVGYG